GRRTRRVPLGGGLRPPSEPPPFRLRRPSRRSNWRSGSAEVPRRGAQPSVEDSHNEAKPAANPGTDALEDQAVEAPHASGSRAEHDEHAGHEYDMKALLALAHPLGREAVVQAEVETDQRRQAGREPDNQAHACGDLAPRLKNGPALSVGEHCALEEVFVPPDRVPCGELGDALGMKREEPG